MLLPARSGKVYISFSTMSVVSPILLMKMSVGSMIGGLISWKPYTEKTSRASDSALCHRYTSGGRMSWTPFRALYFTGLFPLPLLVEFEHPHVALDDLFSLFLEMPPDPLEVDDILVDLDDLFLGLLQDGVRFELGLPDEEFRLLPGVRLVLVHHLLGGHEGLPQGVLHIAVLLDLVLR